MSIGREFEAIDAHDAVVGVGFAEGSAVVDDIIVVGAGDVQDRVVTGASCDRHVLLQNLADALEGTSGRIGHGVGHGIIGAAPAAFGPHEIIFAVAGYHIGPFHIAFRGDLFEGSTVGEGYEAFEIGAEFGDIAMLPAAIDHIILSVFVFKDGLVDGLGAIVEFIDQGFTEIVFIGPLGVAGHCYADTAFSRVVLNIIGGEEEIVAIAFFCDGGRPHGAMSPADGVGIEDMGMFGPLDEVGGGEGVEEYLFIVFIGIGRIDPVSRVEDRRFGVGVPAGEDGVAGLGGQGVDVFCIGRLGECCCLRCE